jgi:hypothetical protein
MAGKFTLSRAYASEAPDRPQALAGRERNRRGADTFQAKKRGGLSEKSDGPGPAGRSDEN